MSPFQFIYKSAFEPNRIPTRNVNVFLFFEKRTFRYENDDENSKNDSF